MQNAAPTRPELILFSLAAFLTQSVNLDDGTTIRFEIWYD